jgi:hypothetical protein
MALLPDHKNTHPDQRYLDGNLRRLGSERMKGKCAMCDTDTDLFLDTYDPFEKHSMIIHICARHMAYINLAIHNYIEEYREYNGLPEKVEP